MKVVIACAGSKDPGAGRLTVSGKKIVFVANPECYPARQGERAVRPDDKWCDELRGYQEGKNPCGLYRAADLYTPNEPVSYTHLDVYKRQPLIWSAVPLAPFAPAPPEAWHTETLA